MNDIFAKIKNLKSTTLILIEAVFVAIIGLLIGVFLIVPTFLEMGRISQEIESKETSLEQADQKLALLQTQDKTTLAASLDFVKVLVPETSDLLHFTALNEIIAADAKTRIDNVQLVKVVGKSALGSTSNTSNLITTAKVTYSSDFDSLLDLVSAWDLADQVVGVSEVSISSVTGSKIAYTVSYDLPTATVSSVVSDLLTASEAQKIKDLQTKLIYKVSTTSSSQVSKTNQFN